jgi:hypothetical protein
MIAALLINADLVIVTINVYVCTLITPLPVENIAIAVTSTKPITRTGAPNFTMTYTRISWRDPILGVIVSIIITYCVATISLTMF